EVGLGVVPPGTRPQGAYDGLDHTRPVLANERVELHQNQRDFLGPFVVPAGKGLGLLVDVVGTPSPPALGLLLVPPAPGHSWLATYPHPRVLPPPPAAPLADDVVSAGSTYRRSLPVPPGSYYLVLDNTPLAGRTSPPTSPRDDRALLVNYAVDLE